MTRTTSRPARRPAKGAKTSRARTAAVLLALGAVVTAGAPSVVTIKPGDTLWDLARSHGTTVAELRRLNDLDGNGTIYAGSTLQVPGGPAAPARRGVDRVHVVRSGDTLSDLGRTYAVSPREIASRNGLSGDLITIGRSLTIPGAAAPSGAAPRADDLAGVPTTNAGLTIPESVRRSVASHRATLRARSHPSKEQVRRMVAATARQHGVSPSLAVSVAYHESGFQQGVVSGVDAIGVMQVLPSTGRVVAQQNGRSLDLLNTQDNITAGVLLLKQLVRTTGSTDGALAGYYQGLGSVSRRGLLPQTHAYIRSIHTLQARFPNG